MTKTWLPLMLAPLGLALAGCGKNLVDNAPMSTQVYFATTATDLAACGTIQVSGNITRFALKPSQGADIFHLGLKSEGYVKTPGTDDEVVLASGDTPGTLVMKRPGAYSYSFLSLFRYDWKVSLLCEKSGKTTSFSQSGTFNELHRAVVVSLTTSQGSVSATLKEYLNTATPGQMNLP